MILRPIISERSMHLTKTDFYTFEVSKDSTKDLIARLIKAKFGVDVLTVRTINITSKKKMQKSRRGFFSKASFKKAVVQIKKGQKIALFEVAEKESEKENVKVTTVEGEVISETKEKKSLLSGTKVKIEKTSEKLATSDEKKKGSK